MEQGLVLLLLGFASFHSATGLKCYVCNNFQTGIDALNTALNAIGVTDENCLSDNVDVTKLTSVECPGASASCVKATGEAAVDYFLSDATVRATVRACLPSGAGTDKCETTSADGLMEAMSLVPGLTLKKVEVTECVCSSDNCNGAVSVSSSLLAVLLTSLIFLLCFK